MFVHCNECGNSYSLDESAIGSKKFKCVCGARINTESIKLDAIDSIYAPPSFPPKKTKTDSGKQNSENATQPSESEFQPASEQEPQSLTDPTSASDGLILRGGEAIESENLELPESDFGLGESSEDPQFESQAPAEDSDEQISDDDFLDAFEEVLGSSSDSPESEDATATQASVAASHDKVIEESVDSMIESEFPHSDEVDNSAEGPEVEFTVPEAVDLTEPEAADLTEPEAADLTEPEAADLTEPEAADLTEPEAADLTEPEAADFTELETQESQSRESDEQSQLSDAISGIQEEPAPESDQATEPKTLEEQVQDSVSNEQIHVEHEQVPDDSSPVHLEEPQDRVVETQDPREDGYTKHYDDPFKNIDELSQSIFEQLPPVDQPDPLDDDLNSVFQDLADDSQPTAFEEESNSDGTVEDVLDKSNLDVETSSLAVGQDDLAQVFDDLANSGFELSGNADEPAAELEKTELPQEDLSDSSGQLDPANSAEIESSVSQALEENAVISEEEQNPKDQSVAEELEASSAIEIEPDSTAEEQNVELKSPDFDEAFDPDELGFESVLEDPSFESHESFDSDNDPVELIQTDNNESNDDPESNDVMDDLDAAIEDLLSDSKEFASSSEASETEVDPAQSIETHVDESEPAELGETGTSHTEEFWIPLTDEETYSVSVSAKPDELELRAEQNDDLGIEDQADSGTESIDGEDSGDEGAIDQDPMIDLAAEVEKESISHEPESEVDERAAQEVESGVPEEVDDNGSPEIELEQPIEDFALDNDPVDDPTADQEIVQNDESGVVESTEDDFNEPVGDERSETAENDSQIIDILEATGDELSETESNDSDVLQTQPNGEEVFLASDLDSSLPLAPVPPEAVDLESEVDQPPPNSVEWRVENDQESEQFSVTESETDPIESAEEILPEAEDHEPASDENSVPSVENVLEEKSPELVEESVSLSGDDSLETALESKLETTDPDLGKAKLAQEIPFEHLDVAEKDLTEDDAASNAEEATEPTIELQQDETTFSAVDDSPDVELTQEDSAEELPNADSETPSGSEIIEATLADSNLVTGFGTDLLEVESKLPGSEGEATSNENDFVDEDLPLTVEVVPELDSSDEMDASTAIVEPELNADEASLDAKGDEDLESESPKGVSAVPYSTDELEGEFESPDEGTLDQSEASPSNEDLASVVETQLQSEDDSESTQVDSSADTSNSDVDHVEVSEPFEEAASVSLDAASGEADEAEEFKVEKDDDGVEEADKALADIEEVIAEQVTSEEAKPDEQSQESKTELEKETDFAVEDSKYQEEEADYEEDESEYEDEDPVEPSRNRSLSTGTEIVLRIHRKRSILPWVIWGGIGLVVLGFAVTVFVLGPETIPGLKNILDSVTEWIG